MAKSKARNLADLLAGTGSAEFQGESGIILPDGTTAQRPSPATVGTVRYNTDIGKNEVYDSDGWTAVAGAPYITSLNVDALKESDSTQTIVITGTNLTNADCVLIDTNGNTITPTTTTVNSSTQLTITFSGGDVLTDETLEPFSIQVTTSGGTYVHRDSLTINNTPSWTTGVGSVGTVYEDVAASIQLAATDPEGSSLTYSITSGALPTGMSLSSTGAITGTPNVNDSYAANGVTHNFTVTASDGANSVPRAFSILRKWKVGETAETAVTPSEISNIVSYGVPSSVYYIDLPTVGATPFYIDTQYDGGGWVLALSGDRYVGDGTTSPPRDGVAAYPKDDSFYLGNRGSNQNWAFDGHTLNTGNTEKLFKYFNFTKLRVAGNSFTGVDSSGYDFNGYYDNPAWEAYKYWNAQMTSNASSTFASKLANLTGWTQGTNAKQNLVYNQSWSTSYSAGNFKLGWYQTSGPSYGDYNQCWIAGGQAQRQGLSSGLWREMYPGASFPLHDSPTTVAVSLGYASHRSGGSHYNNSLWFKV